MPYCAGCYVRLKKDRVVIHWACEFIQSRKALLRPDEEVGTVSLCTS